jgi:hypothetical protein
MAIQETMNRIIDLAMSDDVRDIYREIMSDVHSYDDAVVLADAMLRPGEGQEQRDVLARAIWERALMTFWEE